MRYQLLILSIALVSGCIGKASDPRTKKNNGDELPTYLVHAVGSQKINELLHNPLDVNNPGLFIEDMLYLLDKSNVDKLIALVRGTDTVRVLKLTYNIKRMGCNRLNPALNILLPPSYLRCSLNDFNHLDILVRMINGTGNIDQLIQVLNQISFGSPLPMNEYLEKLAYLIVYIGSVDKVFQLLNGVIDTRDIIFFIDQLDPTLVAPASIGDIQSGVKLADMDKVLRILEKLNDGNKIFELINGVRPLGEGDTNQQAYLVNLITVMKVVRKEVGELCPSDTGITTLASLINNLMNAVSLVYLIKYLNATNVANLVNYVAGHVDSGGKFQGSQSTDAIDEPNPSVDCATRDNLQAGGQKLAAIMNQITQVWDLIFIINNLDPDQEKGVAVLAGLVNRLNVDDAYKLGQLLNDVTPAGPPADRYYWNPNPGSRHLSTGVGKVVNLLNGLDSGAPLVKLLNNIGHNAAIGEPAINGGRKLPELLNGTANSSNLVGFLNAIIRTPSVTINDLAAFITTMHLTTGIPRLIRLVEQLNDASETAGVINPDPVHYDIAGLMAQQNADIALSGIGTTAMATLLNGLMGNPEVDRLIQILNTTGIFDGGSGTWRFTYNNATPNIPRRQGLVRLITFGVTYNFNGTPYPFPAVGPDHMATVINKATKVANLIDFLNSTSPYINIADVTTVLACSDKLDSHAGPCAAINMGW